MDIMPNRMDRGYYMYQREFEEKALEVLRSGWYVLGKEVASFEEEFAQYTGSKYCVGLASGLDALWIAFRILGIKLLKERFSSSAISFNFSFNSIGNTTIVLAFLFDIDIFTPP